MNPLAVGGVLLAEEESLHRRLGPADLVEPEEDGAVEEVPLLRPTRNAGSSRTLIGAGRSPSRMTSYDFIAARIDTSRSSGRVPAAGDRGRLRPGLLGQQRECQCDRACRQVHGLARSVLSTLPNR